MLTLLCKLAALHDISEEEQQAVIGALEKPCQILCGNDIVPD